MTNIRMLKQLPGLLLITALACEADEPSEPPTAPWLADPMGIITEDIEKADLPEGLELSHPHTLGMDIRGEETCYELHVWEHSLGDIANPMRAGDGLVFEKCESIPCADDQYCFFRSKGQECNHGWVWGWFVAGRNDKTMRELEGLGWFSNPMPCGSRLAYWAYKELPEHDTDSEYFVYVADVESGAILRRDLIGQAWIGTDFAFHLAVPKWKPDCSEVLFHDERYFPPKRFTFAVP